MSLLFANEPDVEFIELHEAVSDVFVDKNTTHGTCLNELVVLNECTHTYSLGKNLESDCAKIEWVDMTHFFEKNKDSSELDATVEWVDMTQFFEKEKVASNCYAQYKLRPSQRVKLKLIPELELHKALTSMEMVQTLLAYEGVGDCYFNLLVNLNF